jgi:signal transduction histidine kinase
VKQGISVLAAPARRLNFLSVVAHDLRQPMSAALMATQLVESYLDDTSAPPLARKHIAMAQRCMRETLQLASDLLAMEQANAGVLRLRLAPVDVHALLRDAWALVAQDARARSIDVQLRVPRHLPRPEADRDRLLQVLTNLCANAVRFIGRDGRIELSASHDDHDVRLAVSDTGPGVSDGDLPHLFEQYWQAEHGAADAGVGLGLTIAKSLVEAHGGRIMAERARSGGLTVAFTVPIAAS